MIENCVSRFFERAKKTSENTAFYVKKNGSYEPISWDFYKKMVTNFAKGIMELGHEKGNPVAILSFNRPEWLASCIGTQATAGISAGIYTSCSSGDVRHVISHSEAKIVIIENKDRFEKQILPIIADLEHVKHFVLIEDASSISDSRVMSFERLLEIGSQSSSTDFENRKNEIKPTDIATFIYTSGTTGPAKAVMLSHKAIDYTVSTAISHIHVNEEDILLSYLPLAHVAEQMFSVYAPIYSGMVLYFAESLDKLPENLKEAKPTIFFGVPRVYEKFYEKLSEKIESLEGLKKSMFEVFGNAASQYWTLKHASKSIPPWLQFQYWLGEKLIFKKIKDAIGLSRTRVCISGAAPISKNTIDFFAKLDLPIYEVYGQSEDSGPTSFNIPGETKVGTVGKPFPGVKVRIAADGEILVKGPNLFSGYFKDDSSTNEALEDGWLLSGDIGEIDSDGYLKITDRKKDLLITAGGKNVAPQNLESLLKEISLVSSAVVVGDKKKYLAALLTPNFDNMKNFASRQNIVFDNDESLLKNQKILSSIQEEINRLNKNLTPVNQIKKFHLLDHDFSIEGGELTPTMKVKRKVVNARYEKEINQLYA